MFILLLVVACLPATVIPIEFFIPNSLVDSVQLTEPLEFPPRGKGGRSSTPNFGHDPAANALKWATQKQNLKFFAHICKTHQGITKINFKTIGSAEVEKRENAPRGATFFGPPCT
ncbi:MAG: hypothetical protein GY820_02810 [Gammaproteobacteria bacterium]|nr:hypothetical protein [Gammaproteobacteria bacterium]